MIKTNDPNRKISSWFLIKKWKYPKTNIKSCVRKSKTIKKKIFECKTLESTVELSESPLKWRVFRHPIVSWNSNDALKFNKHL